MMRQRTLADGTAVSVLSLGAMWFGTRTGEATSFAILDRFTEAGGTLIDTSDNYAFWEPGGRGGESETVLGRWLAARGARDRVRLSSKVGAQPTIPGTSYLDSAEGLSAPAIRSALEGSLRRLGTDHLDVYWAHIEDRSVTLEETVDTFASLIKEGKAGVVGASNHATWRVERPEAITMKSPISERPRRSMATMSSALSSSSEAMMTCRRSSLDNCWGSGRCPSGAAGAA